MARISPGEGARYTAFMRVSGARIARAAVLGLLATGCGPRRAV